MELQFRQISSLEKVRSTDALTHAQISEKTVLKGERFSYQICMHSSENIFFRVSVESDLADHIRIYNVQEACMDAPVTVNVPMEDYITHEPGQMPDILVPLQESGNIVTVSPKASCLWVKVDVPEDMAPGSYPVKIRFRGFTYGQIPAQDLETVMNIQVADTAMPQQKLIYTRWFYADCIAVAHNVEIFSEAHWDLIEKYVAAASDLGINMILVPIHTPPLDTEVGTRRPCVQLVDIEKKGDVYEFSFKKFRRFIAICKKHNIRYYEMAHMFSQWGAKCAPNIMVTENGKKDYMFGWHVAANSEEYTSFLKQYIKAVSDELVREGISENTYFHVSDEPYTDTLETYQTAYNIIRPLIGNSKTFDALSNYIFYEKGLVECPVTGVGHIHEFLEHDIPNQWAYYCCGPQEIFTNSLMAMPSCRTRILGFLLYKYNIKGFLHWGLNYYNACRSLYPINPYVTTSGDKAYPSGDPFIVYPGKDTVYPSIRGEVTFEAIQDMNVCFALEERIGREKVVEMIDRAAGRNLRFDDYPSSISFLEGLRAEMIATLA